MAVAGPRLFRRHQPVRPPHRDGFDILTAIRTFAVQCAFVVGTSDLSSRGNLQEGCGLLVVGNNV